MIGEIKIVGASAGTGKTTRLADEFVGYVQQPEGLAIDPSSILVSTFTTKAAEELVGRIRERLIEEGNVAAAQLVMTGYVGTVNSICGKILSDYALEAGLSPLQNVIPANLEQQIFNLAVEPVFDSYSDRIEPIAKRLGFDELPGTKKYQQAPHWTKFVKDICHFARSNRLAAGDLEESARRSSQDLSLCLASPREIDPDKFDVELAAELDATIQLLEDSDDTTNITQKRIKELIEIRNRAKRGTITWSDWVSIAFLQVGKKSRHLVVSLVNIAKEHHQHPRLGSDLMNFIHLIFACAREALDAYSTYKSTAGLMDFTDQECLALDLLENPEVANSLSSRITIALIDEFQDTSPIQLALFLKLAAIAKQSIWVGDIKQAIYGFRGTDPQLMQNAVSLFCKDRQEQLQTSYRSNEHLIKFSNELFKRAFAQFDFPSTSVEVHAARRSTSKDTVIELWNCEGTNLENCYDALASAVKKFLASGRSIENKTSKSAQPVKGSDIAILCRTNDRCEGVAKALAAAGLRVAMTREGLLEAPECILALAVLRYLIDKRDRFALATIIHLTRDYKSCNQADWLTEWLKSSDNPESLLTFVDELEEARGTLFTCTAVEALQQSISSGQVLETAFSWGNVQQRSSNLDALRGLAIEYENACSMHHSAASPLGFILFLNRLSESKQPASEADDAVNVLTYHGSKGLEWPVVVLADVDKGDYPTVNRHMSKVTVRSDATELNKDNPLSGRWLRFWPWPYGKTEKNVHLAKTIEESAEFKEAVNSTLAENLRLLYVGVTRARDVLCIAPYTGRKWGGESPLKWFHQLKDAEKQLLFNPPNQDGDGQMKIGDTAHRLIVRTYDFSSYSDPTVETTHKTSISERKRVQFPSLNIKPSQSVAADQIIEADFSMIQIGSRIPFTGSPNMESLGKCIHQFLAADVPGLSAKKREDMADSLRKFYRLSQIENKSLLALSDRFSQHINTTFGNSKWYRECPLQGRIGNQRVRGVMDLLLETDSSFSIFDHKSFPGANDVIAKQLIAYAGQLSVYAQVMQQASAKPVNGLYVHMPIVGKIVDLSSLLSLRGSDS